MVGVDGPGLEFVSKWAWRDRADHWTGGYMEGRFPALASKSNGSGLVQLQAVVEAHVTLSPAYGVPTLLFRATSADDATLDVSQLLGGEAADPHRSPLLVPELHPILDEVFWTPHACMTGEALELLTGAVPFDSPPARCAAQTDQHRPALTPGLALLAWWSLVGPVIQAGLQPSSHASAVTALQAMHQRRLRMDT